MLVGFFEVNYKKSKPEFLMYAQQFPVAHSLLEVHCEPAAQLEPKEHVPFSTVGYYDDI